MKLAGFIALASPALMLVTSCSDGLGPEPIVACEPEQEVTVSVNSDRVPFFTWSPACGMASIQVFPTSGSPTSGWVLYTGSHAAENPLRSGIRYGTAPSEALEPGPATALAPGVEYTIVVYRWVGDPGGLGSLFPRGSAPFQR
jgi:hypothetical protein